jgi:hypothetical protein
MNHVAWRTGHDQCVPPLMRPLGQSNLYQLSCRAAARTTQQRGSLRMHIHINIKLTWTERTWELHKTENSQSSSTPRKKEIYATEILRRAPHVTSTCDLSTYNYDKTWWPQKLLLILSLSENQLYISSVTRVVNLDKKLEIFFWKFLISNF